MEIHDLLLELYGRIREHVHQAVDGLTAEELTATPERLQPDRLDRLAPHPGAGPPRGRAARPAADLGVGGLGPPLRRGSRPQNTGFGHGPEEVAAIRPEGPEVLAEYYAAVAARTDDLLRRLRPADLDRVVDRRWDPPVTLGVRLVSIADDDIQHAGQAKYVRGLLERRRVGG